MVDQSSPTLTSDKHVNFVQDVSIRHLTNLNLRTLAFLGTEDYLSTSRMPMLKFSENGENQNFDIGNLAAKGLRTHWMHLIFHVTLTIKRGPLLSSGPPVCLVCLQQGDEGEVGDCKECSLPLCKSRSKGCSKLHKRECEVMSGGVKELTRTDLFTVVAVVRLLWQAERDTSIRALLDPLMDHREGKEDEEGRKNIAAFLAKRGLEEEAVLRVLGV